MEELEEGLEGVLKKSLKEVLKGGPRGALKGAPMGALMGVLMGVQHGPHWSYLSQNILAVNYSELLPLLVRVPEEELQLVVLNVMMTLHDRKILRCSAYQ